MDLLPFGTPQIRSSISFPLSFSNLLFSDSFRRRFWDSTYFARAIFFFWSVTVGFAFGRVNTLSSSSVSSVRASKRRRVLLTFFGGSSWFCLLESSLVILLKGCGWSMSWDNSSWEKDAAGLDTRAWVSTEAILEVGISFSFIIQQLWQREWLEYVYSVGSVPFWVC